MHHHVPLCKSCKRKLDKDIRKHGPAIITELEKLREAQSPSLIAEVSQRVLRHAFELVKYEDFRLKTIEPVPTAIIHLVRIQEYSELFPTIGC